MASIAKRGNSWVAQVCVDLKRKSRSFATKRDAVAWANEQEENGILAQHTLLDAIERYNPISEAKRGAQPELSRLNSLSKADFARVPLEFVTPAMIAAYRDARLKEVGTSSVNREMVLFDLIMKVAINEWGWARSNPAKTVTKPQNAKPRRRGISQDEIDTITEKLSKTRKGQLVADMFHLSLETAMRLGEIAAIKWDDVSEKTVTLPRTKNGDIRHVPLSEKARAILAKRREIDSPVPFPVESHLASLRFQRASINDVHFHDARSEAITRLAKKLDVMQLARAVGHRDLKSLLVYYAEKPEDIADRL